MLYLSRASCKANSSFFFEDLRMVCDLVIVIEASQIRLVLFYCSLSAFGGGQQFLRFEQILVIFFHCSVNPNYSKSWHF